MRPMTYRLRPDLILRRLASGAWELATIDGDALIRGPELLCREYAARMPASPPPARELSIPLAA
jgi:hypothetical protein